MTKSLLSIIIPVFNGLEYTQKCLESLEKQLALLPKYKTHIHTVVVDDGSQDGTSEWIRDNYKAVHVLQGTGSLWWSGGINKGVKYALEELATDYILWWNNDVIPIEDYLINLINIIEEYPKDVIIGSKIFMLHNNLIWGMGGKFDRRTGEKFMYGLGKQDNEQFQKPLEVDWFPGMGTTFHRSVFEKTGYLDQENFPQYHGDSDYTLRAKSDGFRLIAFPQLVIYNDNSNTGIIHQGSFRNLFASLTSIKSNFNVQKNILFVKKHAVSPRAYIPLMKRYFYYVGGFVKGKLLNTIGVKKA